MISSPDETGAPYAQRLRVLHVAEVVMGGVATYLNEVLPWQARQYGQQAVAILLPTEHIRYLSDDVQKNVTLIPYHRSGRNFSSCWRLLSAFRNQMQRFSPQLIHAHSSFAGFVTRIPGLTSSRVPIIYTPHGWAFEREDSIYQRKIYAMAERRLANRAAAIVTCSEYETRAAISVGISRARIRIIPHGIDTARLCTEQSDTTSTESSGPLKLLFIGRLDPQKGFDWLLDAIEPLGDAVLELTVAGSKVLAERDQSQKRANIHYAGWVSQAELDTYIDACDAVIMPSRWEGFPFVVLEALRRGRPLFVSNRGALPEMVGHGEAGYVFSLEQPNQLRDMLCKISHKHLMLLRENARQRFLSNYTSKTMNERTLALYKEAVAGE